MFISQKGIKNKSDYSLCLIDILWKLELRLNTFIFVVICEY